MIDPKKSSEGAVLIEVLLAVAILAFGLTAVLQAMMSHARAASLAAEYVRAVNVLDQAMTAKILAQPIKDAAEDQGPCSSDDEKFRCTLTLTDTIPSPHPDVMLQKFQAEVLWGSGKIDRSYKVVFYQPKGIE